MTAPAPLEVAILACTEVGASTVYGMYDLLSGAGRDWEQFIERRSVEGPLRPRIVARRAEPMTIANDVCLVPHAALDAIEAPAVVCIPELYVPPVPSEIGSRFGPEVQALKRWHEAGAIIATACSGAVLLAETGLLDGHEATTHWAYCDLMRERYPRITMQPQRALVVTGEGQRLIMAGGGVSWLDMALFLIARLLGVEAAMRVARLNLIDWHDIGQQPFASLARARQQDDSLIGEVQAWIAANYALRSPVAEMAARSGLPQRSFERRFRKATGMAPLEYVHTLRLEEAKHQLETTHLPIEAIAGECGYEDAGYFGRLFSRRVGLTPAQYRRRFGAMRRAIASG